MTPEPFARLDSATGNPRPDPSPNTRKATSLIVVAFVGMYFIRFPRWTPSFVPESRQCIQQIFELPRVVQVGGCQAYRQRYPVAIDGEVMLACQ